MKRSSSEAWKLFRLLISLPYGEPLAREWRQYLNGEDQPRQIPRPDWVPRIAPNSRESEDPRPAA